MAQRKTAQSFNLRKIHEDKQTEMIPALVEYLGGRVGLGGTLRWEGWTKTLTQWHTLRQTSSLPVWKSDPLGNRRAREVFDWDVHNILEVCAAAQRLHRLNTHDRACAATLMYLVMEAIWFFSWWTYER